MIFDEIDSTNAEARRRAEAGETGPLWIAARRQTSGRGRYGRAWDSAHENLAATLLTQTDKPPAEAAQVSFVAALAVTDLASAYVPAALISLKWPNDVLVAGDKVSGVLVESGVAATGGLWLAVGLGVNLASHPENTERRATHLGAHLRADRTAPPDLETALGELAKAFERWWALWLREGFAPLQAAWTQSAGGLGRPVVARLGAEEVRGMAEALEGDGALRVRLADGTARRITAGDVFFAGE